MAIKHYMVFHSFSTSPSEHFWQVLSCAVLPVLFLKPSDPALMLKTDDGLLYIHSKV